MVRAVFYAADEASSVLDVATVLIAGLALVVSIASAAIAKHAITVSRENTQIAALVPSVDTWADGLRTALADYATLVHEMQTLFVPYKQALEADPRNAEWPRGYEDLANQEDRLRSRILLLLDSDDPEHKDFAGRLEELRNMESARSWIERRDDAHAAAERLIKAKKAQIPGSRRERNVPRP